MSRACKLGLFTSEERVRSLIYESAHIISFITPQSLTISSVCNGQEQGTFSNKLFKGKNGDLPIGFKE